MEKIRVIIADDHPAVREGLRRALEAEKDIEIAADSANGEDTIRLAKEFKPDVAIIDAAMPGISGIEAAKLIKKDCPSTAVLILTAYDYKSYVLAALRAGVAGYLLKSTPLEEVVSAIRMAHHGEAVFDLKVVSDILCHLGNENGRVTGSLGELHGRELQVLKLAAKGTSNKELAEQLHISERTVQTHFVNIFRKLGVGSRTEAVLHALKSGWLTMDDLP